MIKEIAPFITFMGLFAALCTATFDRFRILETFGQDMIFSLNNLQHFEVHPPI